MLRTSIDAIQARFTSMQQRRRHRRAVRALRQQDDHILKDIGLTRSAIDAAVRGSNLTA